MNATHITDIKIKNFRGLAELELSGLQAVNLIVGQNNAGKTSLLEAITAVAAPSMIEKLPGLFRTQASETSQFFATDHGGVASRYLRWLVADGGSGSEIVAQIEGGETCLTLSKGSLPARPERGYKWQFSAEEYAAGWFSRDKVQLKTSVVSVQHSTPETLVPSFADAVRSPANEALMVKILNKVDERVQSLRLDYAKNDPFISVDVGLSERVPLPHVGQGIYRMVAILSDLLGQRPQICLIDEIENGIHYTALNQIWRGIAEISRTLGVQVFATTHSRECLEAANRVFFEEDPASESDFAVVQLMRARGKVIGKVLGETRVDAALENDIELR